MFTEDKSTRSPGKRNGWMGKFSSGAAHFNSDQFKALEEFQAGHAQMQITGHEMCRANVRPRKANKLRKTKGGTRALQS